MSVLLQFAPQAPPTPVSRNSFSLFPNSCPERSISFPYLFSRFHTAPLWNTFFHIPPTCVNIQYLFLSLTYFTLYDILWVHLCHSRQSNFIFNGCVIFHCIYVSQFPVHLLIDRLFPCTGYWRLYCSEYWDTCFVLNYGFLSVYVESWDDWIIW